MRTRRRKRETVPQKNYVGRELDGQMGGCNRRCVYETDLINLCTGLSCGQDSNL
jgi:hypothetical protein